MNLYEETNNVQGADNYSISIQNNMNSMSVSNNFKDLSSMSKAKKRRIVIYLN